MPSMPSGPSALRIGQWGGYSTGGSTSSLEDPIQYQFDWGDGTILTWGAKEQNHSWSTGGQYLIKVKARCQVHTNRESQWSDVLSVLVDGTNPTVTINSPTTDAIYTTDHTTIDIGGSASDDAGVMQVLWSNDCGGSGTCESNAPGGTISWAASGILLQPGQNVITVTAHDADNNVGSDTLTVTRLLPAPIITTESPLPPGTVGRPYSETLAAIAGTTPYSWSLASGRLPSGLSLSDGGVISGTPGATTLASFTVQVAGADGLSSTCEFLLAINESSIFHVSTTGNDAWDGLRSTWDGTHGPKATIQAAIDVALPGGDEVIVRAR